jgi:glycosyltransferase involved in cell wall biosynthesis
MRIIEVAVSGTVGTRNMGPVSTDILELSNRFASRGHEVIVADVAGTASRHLLGDGISLVELPGLPESQCAEQSGSRVHRQVTMWSNYYRYVRALASRLDLAGADVVHFHSPQPAFLAQRFHDVQTFYTAHTPLWSLNHTVATTAAKGKPAQRLSVMSRFHAWMEREVIRRGSLTVGLGDYVAAAVPDAPVVTIPNGLDLESWDPIDRSSARAALGFGEKDFVVLFTGRIKHVKGVDVLIDAVRTVAPSLPNLKAFLIGPLSGSIDTRDDPVEPYAREVMALALGLPIRFLGFINNRAIEFRQYLAAADVAVVPSRAEPQGLVVLESLAMGTPVIGSATGGIPAMISPDVGYLFPPGDARALAARIKHAHDHAEELDAMRKAARARVESRFSWDHAADCYLAEFERVVRRRPASIGDRE